MIATPARNVGLLDKSAKMLNVIRAKRLSCLLVSLRGMHSSSYFLGLGFVNGFPIGEGAGARGVDGKALP